MSQPLYVRSDAVRARYGNVSRTTLWRWLKDPGLRFPQPMIIAGTHLWRVDDLDRWDAEQDRARSELIARLQAHSSEQMNVRANQLLKEAAELTRRAAELEDLTKH